MELELSPAQIDYLLGLVGSELNDEASDPSDDDGERAAFLDDLLTVLHFANEGISS